MTSSAKKSSSVSSSIEESKDQDVKTPQEVLSAFRQATNRPLMDIIRQFLGHNGDPKKEDANLKSERQRAFELLQVKVNSLIKNSDQTEVQNWIDGIDKNKIDDPHQHVIIAMLHLYKIISAD